MPVRLILILILISHLAMAQSDGNSTQFWNNLGFGWRINDSWTQYNELTVNFLADKEFTWREVSYLGNVEYSLYPILEALGGLYLATTIQNLDFRTNEVRPFAGLRIHSSVDNRYSIANLSRFEWRNMYNTDDGWNPSFRFRNRTTVAIAINKPKLSDLGMLSVFGYLELFSNSEIVEERFFKQLKYKFGLAYRISSAWRVNIGTLFQQSENTIEQPTNLPAGVITNFILETAIVYRLVKK